MFVDELEFHKGGRSFLITAVPVHEKDNEDNTWFTPRVDEILTPTSMVFVTFLARRDESDAAIQEGVQYVKANY